MNNSPYLDRPLLPLTVALPRMLQEIEAALATAGPVETRRLRQRADLIRELLATTRTAPATQARSRPAEDRHHRSRTPGPRSI